MNPKDPARVLDEISQEHVRPDLDLLPGVLTRIEQGKHTMKPVLKISFAAILLALVALVSFFTVPGVARAVGSLFGFIPGVGTVEQGAPLRGLAAPVGDTRDGYTLTVESAVLDATRTVISYRAAGEFPYYEDPTVRPPMCHDMPVLRLPDGSNLTYPSGQGGANNGESLWSLVYGPVPADVDRAVLAFSCLPDLPAGQGPRDWEFELQFGPAPAALTVYPVVDLPTPTPTQLANPGTGPQPTAAPAPHGVTWALDSLAVLPDGYYLETTLAWPALPDAYEIVLYPDAMHLRDAAGQEAAVWEADGGISYAPAQELSMPLALQTSALGAAGPARLTLDYLAVSQSAFASFTIDVGPDPRPGQTWPVNQEIEIAGHHLRALSARLTETSPGVPGMLVVELESDSGVMAVIAGDLEHEMSENGGSPAYTDKPMEVGWRYAGAFPAGIIKVDISMITVRLDGPWTIEWTPPADSITPVPLRPTPMPSLAPGLAQCPADALLETASRGLPEGLGGRVSYRQRDEMFVSNLDGSGATSFGQGIMADLSPDGSQVVYRAADMGTYVRDLASGTDTLLHSSLGPDVYDNWPRWSPDGSQIAFYRVSPDHIFDLYVMDADGSNLRAVTSGPENEILLGWNAAGTGLYYQNLAIGEKQQSVRLLDLATGGSTEIARLPDETYTVSLSPDGSRLLVLTEQALWLDRLDGTPPVALLATSGRFANQIHPQWSPDGRWVTVNVWDGPDDPEPELALLEVDGCRLVLLEGYPSTWFSAWVK